MICEEEGPSGLQQANSNIVGSTIGLAALVALLLFLAPVMFWLLRNVPMLLLLFAASAGGVVSARTR